MKTNYKLFLLTCLAYLQILCVSAQDNSNCLVGHYTMNGNAKDISSALNHCTVNGATLTTDRFGKSNSAYYFNGSSSLSTQLDPSSFEAMTVTAWIKTTYTGQQSTIVQIVNPVLYTNRFTKNRFFCSFNGTTSDNSSSEEPKTDVVNGEWFFVAAVCDGTTTKLYVNDSLESTFNESLYATKGQLTIGLQSNNMWGFNGSIDEVRIYGCALSGTDVKDIYALESKTPTSINNKEQVIATGFTFNPNPASRELNIKLNSLDATSLQIMDVAGKIVYKQKIQPNNAALTLNLSGYNKGLYLIQLNTENKVYTEKLVIK